MVELSTTQTPSPKSQIMGMVSATTAALLYASNGAIAQYQRGSMVQLLFLRFGIQAIIGSIWWIIKKPQKYIQHKIPWYGEKKHRLNIWCRGFFYWWATLLLWRGLNYVRFGDGMVVWYSSPIIVAVFGKIWLKEHLSKYFAITLILTTIALIFITQPEIIFDNISNQYESMNYKGIIMILISMIFAAISRLLTRKAMDVYFIQIELSSSIQTLIWVPMVIVYSKYIVNDNFIPGDELSFDLKYNLIAISMGFIGFSACLLNIVGYQLGEATKIAWFEYFDLFTAFIYQIIVFHDTPNLWEYIGCLCLIIGASLPLIEQVNLYKNDQANQAESDYFESERDRVSEQQDLLQ